MDIDELNRYYAAFKYGEERFHTLMRNRVREILFVSTFYDAFIFEQEGRLAEQIFSSFHQLNLTYPTRITSVPSAEEALRRLETGTFDLVITMMRVGAVSPFELGRRIKARQPDLPVLLLLNLHADIAVVEKRRDEMEAIDDVFLWNGDPQIFLAMIKYIEDRQNAPNDTVQSLVRVVLLVEDSIYFYSRFLPLLLREMILQTQRLIAEELTDMQKNYRMRTRPKVLLAHTLEDAVEVCRTYKDYLLCVITDMGYPRQGQVDDKAGLKLVRYLRSRRHDIPILMQSSDEALADTARALGVSFLSKHSPTLLHDLRQFIRTYLGFGNFIFRDGDGTVYGEAASLAEFEECLRTIPDASLRYHSVRNHYSAWLLARGEIQLARELRPLQLADFDNSVRQERRFLIETLQALRSRRNRGSIIDFDPQNLNQEAEIVRLSAGSFGGKGRGIAFLNALFATMDFEHRFQNVRIAVPKTAIIGTEEFDAFLIRNRLPGELEGFSDEAVKERFLAAELSAELRRKLATYLERMKAPLAVRSSGLLEDSQAQTFAGIYDTVMLPNTPSDQAARLRQVEEAVKLVYASAFLGEARAYIDRISYRPEDEKLGVILQEVVGQRHGGYVYPHLSGVAQSYNYYPIGPMQNRDGLVSAALGLGQWIVNGMPAYRFCPKYPAVTPYLPEDMAANSQQAFYALRLRPPADTHLPHDTLATLARLELRQAEEDGVLWYLASVWDPDDQILRDGLSYSGPRVLTFANILKYRRLALADMLAELLDIGEKAMGGPIEIEFAVNFNTQPQAPWSADLFLLQIRPFHVHSDGRSPRPADLPRDHLLLYTDQGMGDGTLETVSDLIYLDIAQFDNTHTLAMQQELQRLNQQMIAEGREYILIGPGRWGTRDRFLGVPVAWSDISQARIIVEAGTQEFAVEASQGTHFFHNLVAMNTGYFSVSHRSRDSFIDWEWLRNQPSIGQTRYFRHLRRNSPFTVEMFGQDGVAVIYKE